MKKAGRLCGALAGVCLYAFAVPALAQDGSGARQPTTDRDASVKTLEAWDSYGSGSGEGNEETLEETFFRLSRDFATTSEGGIQPLGSVPVWPRGEMKIFDIRILPFVREAVEWESNFYKQPNTGGSPEGHGSKAEFTHVNEGGFFASTSLMGGRLSIAASVDSIWDVRYGHDAPRDTWDFNGQLGATYHFPGTSGAWVAGGFMYQRRHDPADLPLDGDVNDFGRAISGGFFNFGLDKDVFFGTKMKFEFGIQTNHEMATDPTFDSLNRTETTVYGKVSYPFLRDTTRIFLLLTHTTDVRDSSRINDGQAVGVNVGLEGSIPLSSGEYRGLRGQVSVGFEDALYDNGTFNSGTQVIAADDSGRRSKNAHVQATLEYLVSPRTSVDLVYLHQTEFSFHGNYQLVDNVELTMSHVFARSLTGRVDVFYEHIDPSGRDPQRVLLANGVPPAPNDPAARSEKATNVDREGAGIGLRYAFNDWMDIDFSADVENRNDTKANSFRDYTGVIGFTFYLNALTPKPRVAPAH